MIIVLTSSDFIFQTVKQNNSTQRKKGVLTSQPSSDVSLLRVTETQSESQTDRVLRRYILQSAIALQIPDFLFMEVDYQSNQ